MTGPLAGLRVVEFAGLGPVPFCGMLLADLGANVVRVDRATSPVRATDPAKDFLGRSRRSLTVDLKQPDGRTVVTSLCATADALIEGHRPGVMERLGLGPDTLRKDNPRLVYARLSGWGQNGPLSLVAGHDINYIAVAGALDPIGRRGGPPAPPLALVADFAGGGMLLALGICAALLERGSSGHGQVIDAACVEGASLMMTLVHEMAARGRWNEERGTNLFDSGAPFYDSYLTADGGYVAVGAIEPSFYDELVALLELDASEMYPQYDTSAWERRTHLVAQAVRRRSRDDWVRLAADRDVCIAPVLPPSDVASHPHMQARNAFVSVAGYQQPAPAPRFDRSRGDAPRPAPAPGADTDEILTELGYRPEQIAELRDGGAVR